jgi:translation initiation factor 2B subunit (eIF-2B alpha/beta/delta family)
MFFISIFFFKYILLKANSSIVNSPYPSNSEEAPNNSLHLISVEYDVIPASFIDMIVTELVENFF